MCISSLIARRLLEGKIIQRRTGFSKGLHNNALSRSLHTDTVNTHIQFHKEINSIESPERHNQIFLLICLLAPRKQLFLMKKKKSWAIQVELIRKTQNIWKHWEDVWPLLFKVSICKVMLTGRLSWPGGTQQISLGIFAWPGVPADGANPNSLWSCEKIVFPH